MSDKVKVFSDQSFQTEVLESSLPVIVDFWAAWCGPCKSIAPILDELAAEFDGKIVIGKLNVEDNHKTTANYDVRGIPNLIFFKGGEVVHRIMGVVPKEQIAEAIKKLI